MAGYYDLHLVQGAQFRRTFKWNKAGVAQSLVGFNWASQIRTLETPASPLLADISEYFEISDDGYGLVLTIPGSQTAALGTDVGQPFMQEGINAYWDVFIWPDANRDAAFPFLQGLVSLESSTTQMAVTP